MSHVVPLRRPPRRPRPTKRTAMAVRAVSAPPRRAPGILLRVWRCIWSGWFLGKLFAIAILAAGVYAFTEAAAAPELRVATIEVAGNDLVPAEEIASVVAVADVNVFALRSARLARAVQADPAVSGARVEPRLPNVLHVAVRERVPAVVWDTPTGSVLADGTGLVLRDGTRPLPVVYAPDGPVGQLGERVDAQAVRVAESVGARIDALGLPGGRVEYRPSIGVTLVAPGAPRVVLGFGDDLERKLAAYDAIRRQLEQSRTRAELIDVRFLDRPFYR